MEEFIADKRLQPYLWLLGLIAGKVLLWTSPAAPADDANFIAKYGIFHYSFLFFPYSSTKHYPFKDIAHVAKNFAFCWEIHSLKNLHSPQAQSYCFKNWIKIKPVVQKKKQTWPKGTVRMWCYHDVSSGEQFFSVRFPPRSFNVGLNCFTATTSLKTVSLNSPPTKTNSARVIFFSHQFT